jgi:hypothetical protein
MSQVLLKARQVIGDAGSGQIKSNDSVKQLLEAKRS